MTNAEKYFENENYAKDFVSDYMIYCVKNKHDSVNLESLSVFLRDEAKPTLTEDERVILKNIAKHSDFEKIGRKKIGGLYVTCRINIPTEEEWVISFFDHLFQFIKERRRI